MRLSRYVTPLLVILVLTLTAMLPSVSAQEPSGFTADFVNGLNRVGGRLVALAEAVPAEQFSWRPNEEVRTVSQVYMHVVGTNMLMPSALGAPPPEGLTIPENPFELLQEWEAKVTEKDQVVAKLQASIEYAAQAVQSIPASALDEEVDLFGFPASKRAYLLILLTHAHEHLGQSIAYARSIGVVPPWSRPQQPATDSEPEG